jgi:hypothetical protein
MIQLSRIRAESAIIQSLRGNGRKEKAVSLLKLYYQLDAKFKSKDFNSNYWKAAKPQLELDSNGKCAYCEAPTNAVAHGDVEHFRPKSIYWWLVYCYDNYSYSCQICNETYKGNKFKVYGSMMKPPQNLPETIPTDTEIEVIAPLLFPDPLNDHEGFSSADFIVACKTEDAGFIDPYMFDPEPLFKWEVKTIEVSGELKDAKIEIAPRDSSAKSQNAFKEAKDNLGLNREELCVLRWMRYNDLLIPKMVLENGNFSPSLINDCKKRLKNMIGGKEMFTGMCRYFVRDVWKLNLD